MQKRREGKGEKEREREREREGKGDSDMWAGGTSSMQESCQSPPRS